MSDPVSLTMRRWDSRTRPADHAPRDALAALLHRIDAGEITAEHVIIAVSLPDSDDCGSNCAYFQAGKLNHFGQLGLLTEITGVLRDNAR